MTTLVKVNSNTPEHFGSLIETDLIATDLVSKTSSRVRVINDLFGGLDALPKAYNEKFSGGYYIQNIQTEKLIEDIERLLSENKSTESDRQKLKDMLSNLNEGTNNVVFIGKLKSETKLW